MLYGAGMLGKSFATPVLTFNSASCFSSPGVSITSYIFVVAVEWLDSSQGVEFDPKIHQFIFSTSYCLYE